MFKIERFEKAPGHETHKQKARKTREWNIPKRTQLVDSLVGRIQQEMNLFIVCAAHPAGASSPWSKLKK
jgi:hypothetical protein